MDDQPTCGKGLAERSALHAALAGLLASVADNLEIHTTALDPRDETARLELDAYRDLSQRHRELVAALRETAGRMAGYRDLPMAAHDPEAMASPGVLQAFQDLVRREEELLALLRDTVAQDRAMLEQAGG